MCGTTPVLPQAPWRGINLKWQGVRYLLAASLFRLRGRGAPVRRRRCRRGDAGQQAVEGSEAEGAGHHLGDAGPEQSGAVGDVEFARHDHHRRAPGGPGGGQEELRHLEGIEVRQLVVDDDDVEGVGGQGDDRVPGVPRLLDPVAEHADRDAHQVATVVVTIDDEDPEPLAPGSDGSILGGPGRPWMAGPGCRCIHRGFWLRVSDSSQLSGI